MRMRLAVLAVALLSGCLDVGSDEVARIPSPSGRWEAVVVETNGGATTSLSYQVFTVPAGAAWTGHRYVASLYAAMRSDSAHGVTPVWHGDSELSIAYQKADRAELGSSRRAPVRVRLMPGVSDAAARAGGTGRNRSRHFGSRAVFAPDRAVMAGSYALMELSGEPLPAYLGGGIIPGEGRSLQSASLSLTRDGRFLARTVLAWTDSGTTELQASRGGSWSTQSGRLVLRYDSMDALAGCPPERCSDLAAADTGLVMGDWLVFRRIAGLGAIMLGPDPVLRFCRGACRPQPTAVPGRRND
jgi:hypothetical protein